MHTVHVERAAVILQFSILIKVFIIGEMIVLLNVHMCSPIRKCILRRSHVSGDTVRTSVTTLLLILTNLLMQKGCPIKTAFMRKRSVIA